MNEDFDFNPLKNFTEFVDLYIKDCASSCSQKIKEPSFGPDDLWFLKLKNNYFNLLTNAEYLELFKHLISETERKFSTFEERHYIKFYVANTFLNDRPTGKYFNRYPEEKGAIPVDLRKDEEDELIKIILELKNNLHENEKWRANALLYNMTGIKTEGEYPFI